MKVLQVSCEGLGNGGVQSVIMNICRNIPEVEFDILLFTNERRYYDDEFETLGGKIFRIPKYEGFNKFRKKIDYYIRFFRIFIGTYKIIKNNGPYNVIHCHNDLESGICNLAAYFAGVKVRISHAHTAENKYHRKKFIGYTYKKILQSFMNLTSNLKISCTQKSLVSIYGKKYLTETNSLIIPNPIDTNMFKTTLPKVKDNNLNIVHIGRYSSNKNQIFIVELLPYIVSKYPNVLLQLIGSGEEYKDQIVNKAFSLGVESRVQFLPSNTNVKEVLEKANLFIFPSISEGFGIALIEAQAMNVPCIVSDTVPQEVDCGLCLFLPLSEKKENWASQAMDIIVSGQGLKLDQDKLNSLDIKSYANKINSIYEGEIF